MSSKVITIGRHIMDQERLFPTATGDFSGLLNDLTLAAKMIQREVNKAGLVEILGKAGDTNVQGEEQQKLDVFADGVIFRAMDHGGHLCVMASEENESILNIPEEYPCGKYVLNYDPLDGSSRVFKRRNSGSQRCRACCERVICRRGYDSGHISG